MRGRGQVDFCGGVVCVRGAGGGLSTSGRFRVLRVWRRVRELRGLGCTFALSKGDWKTRNILLRRVIRVLLAASSCARRTLQVQTRSLSRSRVGRVEFGTSAGRLKRRDRKVAQKRGRRGARRRASLPRGRLRRLVSLRVLGALRG